MSEKKNCYQCVHRREIPGDCHTRCAHPDVAADEPFQAALKLNIRGHRVGIQGGWFIWPANFDPRWLVNCDGFEAKAEPKP